MALVRVTDRVLLLKQPSKSLLVSAFQDLLLNFLLKIFFLYFERKSILNKQKERNSACLKRLP